MDKTTHNGFTLIELLVALAVAAILLGVGIPSFSGAIKNSQVSADYNELTQALYMARSEAVKANQRVTVCPRASVDSPECGSSTESWKNGWLVFMDNVFDPNEASASVDNGDEIISFHREPRSKNAISAKGSIDRTKNTAISRNYIRYQQTGRSNWANGSFYLCSDEDVKRSRVVNIAPTGDVRPGRPSGSDYPRDVFNDEACT